MLGRQNASHWLLRTDVDSQALRYSFEELHIAATFCAAELHVSRNIQLPEIELHTFDLVASADELVTGWWKGRQLGLVEFSASARASNGATFTVNGMHRRSWGSDPQATPALYLQARKDMNEIIFQILYQ